MRKNSSPEASLTRLPSGKAKHIHRENHANSGHTSLINSFISDATDKSDENKCNGLGCNEIATVELSLKIENKSIPIFVCQGCRVKFE